jgi:short-subunit dehydrogenase
MSGSLGTALVTGASTGLGAVYADRLAKRGYDLVLVARDEARLKALAERLRAQAGVRAEVLKADLTDTADLAKVEARVAQADITLLVNNAGASTRAPFEELGADRAESLVQLNVVSLLRLMAAATPGMVARGKGSIINIASVLALTHEVGMPIYNATKAFVLMLSRALQVELDPKGVYIQAVLPGATRTEIWDRSGVGIGNLPESWLMEAGDLVDAALVGFDRRELVTIPPLHDEGQWLAFEADRQAMTPNLSTSTPAERYRPAEAWTTARVMESLS